MKQLFAVTAFCTSMLFAGSSIAQEGSISGLILDAETGEELIGAAVYVPSLESGVVSDLNGRFYLQLAPGTYTIEVSYISYIKQNIEHVEIMDGIKSVMNLSMNADPGTLEEIGSIDWQPGILKTSTPRVVYLTQSSNWVGIAWSTLRSIILPRTRFTSHLNLGPLSVWGLHIICNEYPRPPCPMSSHALKYPRSQYRGLLVLFHKCSGAILLIQSPQIINL